MNLKHFLSASCLFFTIFSLKATPLPTLKAQLMEVNPYWAFAPYDDVSLQQSVEFPTDVDLIQTHLLLVEKILSEKRVYLNANQAKNRTNCLEILKKYAKNGIFPINLYHQKRTPYFIDHLGTACAVGHLIIETGHEALAKNITKDNNYAYIEDMNYSELLAWADEFGFEIEELKWIQPSYCFHSDRCKFGEITHVSALGKEDGCIMILPAPINLQAPYTYNWFRLSTDNINWKAMQMTCDLGVGKYKCTVSSVNGMSEDFIYTIEVKSTKVTENQSFNFNIYPNPSQDYIAIDTDVNATFSLTLYNMLGLPMLSQQVVEKQTVISMTPLEKGFYNVVISDGKNKWVKKLVKY